MTLIASGRTPARPGQGFVRMQDSARLGLRLGSIAMTTMVLLGHLLAGQALAATILGDANDCEVQWTLSSPPIAIADLTTTTLLAGTAGTAGKERCPVIPFQLPDFGAVGNPFLSASFSCNIASYVNTPSGNADLYGIGRRSAATVLTNDYWAGTSAVDPTEATFLQGNILLAPPATGIVTTSGAGNTALVNYLNAQYAGGAGAGQFVFLRLSTDTAQTGVERWQITSSEGGAASTNAWPQINFTLAPANAPVDTVRVETRADGAGVVVPATELSTGMVLTNFSIARNGGGVFLSNLPAVWMLTNVTGGVVAGDLVAAPDGKSARFTANAAGSARILAVANATNLVASGVIAVTNVVLYTDTGSPTNPPWSEILPTLNVQSPDPGPVYGSLINVNNAVVEVGIYGNRPISVPSQRIHVACNTSTANFANFTRWFQTDGNTHVLRVFVDDENTATPRTGTSLHNEAFMAGGWNYTNNVTYEWTGHYTIAYLRQGYCAFQLKNSDNDWAFQLGMSGSGTLTVNNRYGTDVLVTNADGTAKNFNGGGFDVRVLDDGKYYQVWIDGVLYSSSSYTRPTGTTTFRWGMYYGANNLNPPADYNLVFVSGPQIKSWPGNLATPTTTVTKANNTTSLNTGSSWVGDVTPGLYNQAVWDSTVTSANTTTLASDQQWAGLKIVNPGGTVTINGSSTLSLDDSGVDLTAATTNFVVNCPVQLTSSSTWGVAAGRTATFNGIIRGYPGFLVSGGGTVILSGSNTFAGTTSIGNLGIINIQHASALGSTSVGTSVSQGASLQLQGGISFVAEPLTLASGTSITVLLQNVSGNNTWNGPIGTSGSGQFVRIASDSGLLTLAGTITGNDPATSVVLQGAGNILVSGKVTGTSGLFSGSTGAGTRTLNNPSNDFSGNTTMSGGTLRLGASGVIPDGSGKGNLVMIPTSPNVATLDLAGFNETINGLTNSGTGSSVVDNSAGNATLTVGGNNQTSTFGGVIKNSAGNLALTKIGSGTLTLSGTNSYTGNTAVNGGTLQILLPSLATNSTISVSQGAVLQLDFTGTNTVAGLITNGVALASGVYNAGNVAPFIAGSGSLKVVSSAPPPQPTIAPVTVSGTNLVVSASTVSGANYVLQSATNLTPTINWSNESTNAGTGGNLMLNVPIEPSQPQKYLRLWAY